MANDRPSDARCGSARLGSEFHQTVVDFIDEGHQIALAIVLSATGSTPRGAGTKAIIDSTGSIWGTIGGGPLESEAQRRAMEAIRSQRSVVFDFNLDGTDAAADDRACDGTLRLLIDPVTTDGRCAYADVAEAMRRRERGVLLTTMAADAERASLQWLARGESPNAAHSVIAHAIESARTTGAPQYFSEAAQEGLAEPLVPTPLLIISGGGHVGQAVAEQARLVGFDIVVVEDRPQFTEASLYPPGVTVNRGKLADLLTELPVTQDVFIAIVGRGHAIDAEALAACIHKPAAYIGMLGSRRKVALMRSDFLDSGKATAEQFDRVHAPIGLEIGAETVPEIATSIVAELVAVRRGALQR